MEAGQLLDCLGVRAVGDGDRPPVAADQLGLTGVGQLGATDNLVAALDQQLQELFVPTVDGRPFYSVGRCLGVLVPWEQHRIIDCHRSPSDSRVTNAATPVTKVTSETQPDRQPPAQEVRRDQAVRVTTLTQSSSRARRAGPSGSGSSRSRAA